MSEALKPMSFDDLYRQLRTLPAPYRGEILNGELVVSPRPAVPHAVAEGSINQDVRYAFHRRPGDGERPGGWWILCEPELHLALPGITHVVSPDLAGWRHETLSVLPTGAFITTPPDWICEILSPATERYDRREKSRIYHQAQVRWRWLVNPLLRTVEAYRRDGDFWVLLGTWASTDTACIEPFEAVTFDLATWWEGLPPLEEP